MRTTDYTDFTDFKRVRKMFGLTLWVIARKLLLR
jgi:hypothetical protein